MKIGNVINRKCDIKLNKCPMCGGNVFFRDNSWIYNKEIMGAETSIECGSCNLSTKKCFYGVKYENEEFFMIDNRIELAERWNKMKGGS